jgi:hypothetical protein
MGYTESGDVESSTGRMTISFPPLNVDFSRLSSQVPAKGSLAYADTVIVTMAVAARINPRVAVRNDKNMAVLLSLDQKNLMVPVYEKVASCKIRDLLKKTISLNLAIGRGQHCRGIDAWPKGLLPIEQTRLYG